MLYVHFLIVLLERGPIIDIIPIWTDAGGGKRGETKGEEGKKMKEGAREGRGSVPNYCCGRIIGDTIMAPRDNTFIVICTILYSND